MPTQLVMPGKARPLHPVIASEAKQSSAAHSMDCFVAALLAMTVRCRPEVKRFAVKFPAKPGQRFTPQPNYFLCSFSAAELMQ